MKSSAIPELLFRRQATVSLLERHNRSHSKYAYKEKKKKHTHSYSKKAFWINNVIKSTTLLRIAPSEPELSDSLCSRIYKIMAQYLIKIRVALIKAFFQVIDDYCGYKLCILLKFHIRNR